MPPILPGISALPRPRYPHEILKPPELIRADIAELAKELESRAGKGDQPVAEIIAAIKKGGDLRALAAYYRYEVAHVGAQQDDRQRAQRALALVLLMSGDYKKAEAIIDAAPTPGGSNDLELSTLRGLVQMHLGNPAEALSFLATAYANSRTPYEKAKAGANLGGLHLRMGNLEEAERYFKDAVEAADEHAEVPAWLGSVASGNAALIALAKEDFANARDSAEKALVFAIRGRSPEYMINALACKGDIALQERELDRSLDYYRVIYALGLVTGRKESEADGLTGVGNVLLRRTTVAKNAEEADADLNGALEAYTIALGSYVDGGSLEGQAACHANIGKVRFRMKLYSEAIPYFLTAERLWVRLGREDRAQEMRLLMDAAREAQ